MKLLIPSLLVLILSATNAIAGTAIGLQAGADISTHSNGDDQTTGVTSATNTGLLIGAQLETQLVSSIYFQPELRYVQRGITQTLAAGSLTPFPVVGSLTANYFEIPLLAKVKFLDGQSLMPFVFAGPNFGFKLSESKTVTALGVVVPPPANAPTNFKTFDFSVDFGAGLEFKASPAVGIFAEGRYSLGLINISESTTDEKWRDIQIIGGLNFALN